VVWRHVLAERVVWALQRAVRQEYHRFNRQVEKLEANAGNPDFWAGTASPA
jgi:hypothetical protein